MAGMGQPMDEKKTQVNPIQCLLGVMLWNYLFTYAEETSSYLTNNLSSFSGRGVVVLD